MLRGGTGRFLSVLLLETLSHAPGRQRVDQLHNNNTTPSRPMCN